MKNTFKKIVAFVLAMVIMFGGCVTETGVYAAGSNSGLKMATGDLAAVEAIKIPDNTTLNNSTVKSTKKNLKSSFVETRVWDKYSSNYVESKLNSYEKTLYNNLDEICHDFLVDSSLNATYQTGSNYSGYYLPVAQYTGLSSKEVERVIELFVYENPQYYFTTVSYLTNSTCVYLYCYDKFAYGEDRAQTTNAVFDKLDKYVATAKKATDVEKTAHDLICKNVSYQSGTYDQSMYSALMEGKTVCAGYSQTLSAILNACGMETVLAYSKGHAWNKVKTSAGWKAVDSTWDDQGSKIVYYWYNKSDSDIRYKDTRYDHYIEANVAKYLPAATIESQKIDTTEAPTTKIPSSTSAPATTERTGTTETDVYVYDGSDSMKELETPTITSLTAVTKKSIVFTFDRVEGATNYEIKCSTSASFKEGSNTDTYTIKDRYSAVKISKLTKNKRYYVKMRQVKIVGGQKNYSRWSNVKTVCTMK